MDLMAGDSHWKPVYDGAPAVDFVMLGMNRPIAVAGHLTPSVDTSGRRFPFLTACTLELQEPEKFFTMSALQLESVWERLNEASHKARLPEVIRLGFDAPSPRGSQSVRFACYWEEQGKIQKSRLKTGDGSHPDAVGGRENRAFPRLSGAEIAIPCSSP